MSNKITPIDGVESGGQDNAAFATDPATESQEPGDGSTLQNEPESIEKKFPDVEVPISDEIHDKPYSGMGKEDLIRFSDTPFWNRFRLISVLLFWAAWLALLGAVIGLTIVAPRCSARPTPEWWQKSTIYQIYVRSFFDENNDSIGDIKGIISKLDYLQELKVDAILLSSIYESNAASTSDIGYEVTDHTAVKLEYGSLQDMDDLIEDAHNRSISVLLDFIPNYTSLNHPWFVASSSDSNSSNRYWNYYVWAACDSAWPYPNNWMGKDGNTAWTYVGARGECYLHQFRPAQPELNLRSSYVQDELTNILKFWLERGIDGFKVSSTSYLFESQDLINEPDSCVINSADCKYTRSQPETIDIVKRWRIFLDDYSRNNTDTRKRILLTDSDINGADTLKYYGSHSDGSHLPINYLLSSVNYTTCDGLCLSDMIKSWIGGLPDGATADWLNGDQDRSRVGTYANGLYVNALNLLKMTLPGSALIYYGEEIGMKDYLQQSSMEPFNRDTYRGPMQWTNDTDGGGPTWIQVDPTSVSNNVWNQSQFENSPLGIFKALGALRAGQDSLQYGKIHFVSATSSSIVSYVREQEGFDRLLVVINFGSTHAHSIDLTRYGSSDIWIPSWAELVLVINQPMYNIGDDIDLRSFMLDPGQGFIAKWKYTRPQ